MTKTVRTFIDLSDLVALQVECGHCKASLSLPVDSMSVKVPQMCPSCHSDWYDGHGNGRNMGDVITSFVAELKRLRRILEGKDQAALGFTLDLEVNGLSVAPAPSDRERLI